MRNLVASSRRASTIVGKRWIEARDQALKLIRQGYPLIAIVGRAGCGKTHLMLNLYDELKEYARVYIDTTLLDNRLLGTIVSAVATSQTAMSLIRAAKCPRGDTVCKRLRDLLMSGIQNLAEYARRWPTTFLRDLMHLVKLRGYRGLVLFMDEGAISSDDPQIQQFIRTLHAFRNLTAEIENLHVVFSILPDVVEYIAKVDVPLVDVIRTAMITLPDYVEIDDIQELAKVYPARQECFQRILESYETLPPLTVRQAICLLQECDNPAICGIEETEIKVE